MKDKKAHDQLCPLYFPLLSLFFLTILCPFTPKSTAKSSEPETLQCLASSRLRNGSRSLLGKDVICFQT
jgi:hypothetical protein